jgi:chemotaxis protein methyltransferase CheR
MTQVSKEELKAFAQYIHRISGIWLDESKGYLLENRLAGMLQDQGCGSFSELLYKIRGDATRALERRLIDQITTGETLFFRDQAPFELLQHKILPDLIDRRGRTSCGPIPLRIWSAACSNGQEVYSIAMVLAELLGGSRNFQVRILGTDISDRAVANASRGIYNRVEIERGLPPDKLRRYFTPEADGAWKVRDELRAMATFRTLNLKGDFSALGRFDVVFCRNVAIYFTDTDRADVFNRLGRVMEPDGCLVIGGTESLSGLCPQYLSQRYLRSIFYQLAAAHPPAR